ncbi:MAG: enoyl-CoA hydratase/isomerase family protein [Methylocystis sp.]|nr:enoyl-CoA hydratase/isomerase family protein [Methylocystis sp.]
MHAKVIVRRDDAVLRIVMNRPDKKNALDRDMYERMTAALTEADADPGLRAILIEGAGGVFTAGNDLSDLRFPPADLKDFPALRFVRALAACQTPLVAAVEGDAVGVGATMLFHCDLVYAAPSARFKMPFVDLGLVPEAASSLLVPERLGLAKAAQFLLLCEGFDADEALRLNIVNAIAPPGDLGRIALAAAGRLAEKPSQALAATRRLLRSGQEAVAARLEEEGKLFAQALASPTVRARIAAFFARRD